MRDAPGFSSTLSPDWISAAFIVQFIGATVIAYLLFVSCARLKDPTAAALLSVLNIGMWASVLISSVTVLTTKWVATQQKIDMSDVWLHPEIFRGALVVSLVLAFLPVVLAAVLESRLGLKRAVVIGTAATSALVSVGLLWYNSQEIVAYTTNPCCIWISALAAAYLVLAWRTKSSALALIGRVALALDALLMLMDPVGYYSLTEYGSTWWALGYLAAMIGLAWLAWRLLSADLKPRFGSGAFATVFLVAAMSWHRIAAASEYSYLVDSFFLVVAVGLLVIRWLARGKADIFFRIVEFIVIMYAAQKAYYLGGMAYPAGTPLDIDDRTVPIIMVSLAFPILIVILLDRIRLAAKATSRAMRTSTAPARHSLEVLSGAGLTVAVVGLLSPHQWFMDHSLYTQWGYPISLACMGVALVCVGLGLWSRVKPLRLYGLVVVLASVLKLVLLDIGSVSSVTRVVAFLGGAAICFGISALYNYAARHFDKELAQEIPEEAAIPAEVAPASPEVEPN